MNSIGLAVAIIIGGACGLLIIGRYPAGLDPAYGAMLLALAYAASMAALLAKGHSRACWTGLFLMSWLIGCGLALMTHHPITQGDLAYYNGPASGPASGEATDASRQTAVTVEGVVSSEPVFSDRSQRLRISAQTIKIGKVGAPKPVHGDLYAVVSRYPEYGTGERLALSGALLAPPSISGFDYAAYLARQGIFSYMNFPKVASIGHTDDNSLVAAILAQRPAVRRTLQHTVAEPQASLAVGVVVGDRSSMSSGLLDDFKRSGTIQILAISGQNIALLVGLPWLFYGGRSQRRKMPLGLTLSLVSLIAVYTVFTGATPSVVRAAIMGVVLLMAPGVGRRYDPVAALAVSAAVMTMGEPGVLADAGFQLSFLSMLGVSAISPHLFGGFKALRVGRVYLPTWLALPLSVSIGAQAITWPLVALLNGHLSLVSPIANLMAEVALLPLMVSGIITAIAGILGPIVAFVPALATWLSASWLLWWVQFWASPDWASVEIQGLNGANMLLYYALLACVVMLKAEHNRTGGLRPKLGMAALALLLLALAVWTAAVAMLLS